MVAIYKRNCKICNYSTITFSYFNTMKIAFTTNVSSDKIVYYGLLKLIASFRKFHPDIPLFVFTEKEIEKEVKKRNLPAINWFYLNPIMCAKVAEKYDLVVHIDADSIVCDYLTEILDADYDVAVVRNNNDFGKASAREPFTLNDQVHVWDYANCGLVASTKKEFWEDWIKQNNIFYNLFDLHEQDVMNLMLKDRQKYKRKLLDPVDKPVYYGLANTYGIYGHWDSWKEIEIKDDKLYVNNKLIKILHNGGGQEFEKLNLDTMFSENVSKHLKKLCDVYD